MQTRYNTDATAAAGRPEMAISWRAIFAGAIAATGISLVLMLLGTGLGLAFSGPDPNDSQTVFSFTNKVIIWLIVMQWIASGLGGYIAGRLRTKWTNIDSDETFFRDTTSGLVTWCVATLLTAAFIVTTTAATVSSGGRMALMATQMHKYRSQPENGGMPMRLAPFLDYQTDMLFRSVPSQPLGEEAEVPVRPYAGDARREASAILMNSMKTGALSENDRNYLASLIAMHANISQEDAMNRVNAAAQKVTGMKAEIKAMADKARRMSSTFSLLTALSMFLGAFIAAVTAVIGGRERDLLSV